MALSAVNIRSPIDMAYIVSRIDASEYTAENVFGIEDFFVLAILIVWGIHAAIINSIPRIPIYFVHKTLVTC